MRYIEGEVLKDLQKKMVFIGGPRQCGKTTFVQYLLKEHYNFSVLNTRQKDSDLRNGYFNYDDPDDRSIIKKRLWDPRKKLIIFDELHKAPKWKTWIKGIYDTRSSKQNYLVTGSARLDVYRKGGDSLLGRYHYWRLHPFTLDEIPKSMKMSEALEKLMRVGGFPEPFFDGDEREARRWRRERLERVIKDDIRDLENIKEIRKVELLVNALRERVGSTIVVNHIAQDLEVSPVTVKSWIEALERMYLIFTVKPYTKKLSRSVQKPFKVYFFDNCDVVDEEGARFENLVATTLLKKIQFLEDRDGYTYELNYIRDKEGREVDFVISREGKLQELIEVKYSDTQPSRHMLYYSEKLKPSRATQIVKEIKRSTEKGLLRITSISDYVRNKEGIYKN
jgi:uncharacterized protein